MSTMLPEEDLNNIFRRRLELIDKQGKQATQRATSVMGSQLQGRGNQLSDGRMVRAMPKNGTNFGAGGGYGPQDGFSVPGGTSNARSRILSQASRWFGTPYSWGGGGSRGPSRGIGRGSGTVGFDCSGLVQNVYASVGLNLPRLARQQATMGRRTSINNLKPGDLVAWNNGGHIAIYAGNGQIIEAPRTGLSVRRRALGRNEPVFGVSLNL